MRRSIVLAGAVALFTLPTVAGAQSRWSAEAIGGAAIATEKLGDADLGSGFGFEVNARWRFMPHLAAYAGWDWHHFAADQPIAGQTLDIEETGYAFGLRFEHPLISWTSGWVRAGGVANHIELENDDGEIVADSKHGLGWEVGAGLALPIRERVMITPGFRYRALSRDVAIGGSELPMDLRYFSLGIGAAFTF